MINRVTVLIDDSNKKITLDEIIVAERKKILLKKATIFWKYKNIMQGDYFVVDKKINVLLADGYYTFDDLKSRIESVSKNMITVNADRSTGICTISCGNSSTLALHQNLANLLGMSVRTFLPGSKTVGTSMVNVNKGLQSVNVTCSIIDSSFNFFNGKKSDIIFTSGISTDMGLYGTVQQFNDLSESAVIDSNMVNDITFTVSDQNGEKIEIGEIMLLIYIY